MASYVPPATIRMGTIFGQQSSTGVQRLPAFLMALREINNKADGFGDDLLPNTQILFAARNSKLTFTTAVTASLDLALNVFNGAGVQAVIGSSTYASTKGLAEIVQESGVAQMSFTAFSSFSHSDAYPYLNNIYPKLAYQGELMAHFIHSMKWQRASVFYSNSVIESTDGFIEFSYACKNTYNIDIQSYDFDGATTDFNAVISKAMVYDPRVIVLLMTPQNAATFMAQAYKLGLLHDGVTVIGNGDITTTSIYSMFPTGTNIPAVMKGYFGINYIMSDWMLTPKGQTFVQKFRSLPNTVTTVNGVKVCNTATDDDGGFYLYQYNQNFNASLPYVCAGLTFNSFKADGSNMEVTTGFIYDGFYAIIMAYHELMYNQKVSPTAALLKNVLKSISFDGVTGRVSFSSGRAGSLTYGRGDRIEGLTWTIQNFDPDVYANASTRNQAFAKVGTIASDGVFHQLTGSTGYATSLKFNSLDYSYTSDRPSDLYTSHMELNSQTTLQAFGSLVIILSLMGTVFLYFLRHSTPVKTSQPAPLYFLGISCCLCGIRGILSAYEASDSICFANYWVGHLAVLLGLFAYTVRLWRVYAIVVQAGLKKVHFKDLKIALYILAGLGVCILYMAVTSSIFPPAIHDLIQISITGQKHYTSVCDPNGSIFEIILYIVEGMLAAGCLALCWATRQVPVVVNRAKSTAIVICIFLIIGGAVLSTSLNATLSNNGDVSIGIAFTLCSLFALIISIIYPETLTIIDEKTTEIIFARILRSQSSKKIAVCAADASTKTKDLFTADAALKSKFRRGNKDVKETIILERIHAWKEALVRIKFAGDNFFESEMPGAVSNDGYQSGASIASVASAAGGGTLVGGGNKDILPNISEEDSHNASQSHYEGLTQDSLNNVVPFNTA